MSKTIFYFSATGNSLQAALDIAEGIGGAEVISIAKAGMGAKCDSDVIGFVFPSFCWGMPNMIFDFIESATLNPNAYFFTVVTCGAAMGCAASDVNALLHKKGAKLSYGAKVKMVSNYIVAYDVKDEEGQNKVLAKANEKLAEIIQDIKQQKNSKPSKGFGIIRKLRRKILEEWKTADKSFNVNEDCNGCGICASVCPAKNIEMDDGKPKYLHNCEHCIACMHWCPQKAINFGKSTQKRRRYHHPKVKAEQLP